MKNQQTNYFDKQTKIFLLSDIKQTRINIFVKICKFYVSGKSRYKLF